MARQTAAQKKRQKRVALALVGLLALCLAMAALVAFPGLEGKLYQFMGVTDTVAVPGANPNSPTAVHFIDVGQGDAVLIEQDGAYALVDAGPPEGEDNLLAYLRALEIDELQYVFMSHAHADHIGGMRAVVQQFSVGTVVMPSFTYVQSPTSKIFENLLEAMAAKAQYTVTAQTGEVFRLGTGTITVLQSGIDSDNLNMQSLALLFEADSFRFLTTGDAEKQNEAALVESGFDLSADLFKAGHHGSSTSNTLNFLRGIRPSLVVISCGKDNSYGHPHLEPIENFETVRAAVLRTDQQGHIVVQPDGEGGVVYNSSNVSTEQEAA